MTSSLSAAGLAMSSSSLRCFLRESVETVDAGRFPLRFEDDDGYMCSVGGVPMVSEPWEDGEE